MNSSQVYVHPTAVIETAEIGSGTKIWHFSHVLAGARIGENCVLGQNVTVAGKAIVGNYCKIQNNVSLYDGVVLEDYVFCGPSCVFTNILTPRCEIPRRQKFISTRVCYGTSIGANATIVCGVTLAPFTMVAAGAVVTKDSKRYSLLVGVPARHAGWAGRHGLRLRSDDDGCWQCPESGWLYREEGGNLTCLSHPDDSPFL
jgi:UDP-2-acetamido-3-amino-2,3-dideoxy-glucuronate N-acetyltransferase